MKFLYGILSDGNAFLGYRRKPWLLIGWLGFMVTNYLLFKKKEPDIEFTIIVVFICHVCMQMIEVVLDALCAERGNLESNSTRGLFMTTMRTIKAFGAMVGAILGGILFNKSIWGWGFSINELFLLLGLN